MSIRLGVIADDFTGATDIASFLVSNGFKTIQLNGLPQHSPVPKDIDAVVISLKSRSIAVQDAIAQSLEALAFLQAAGAEQIFFKYCSTFDSTAQGNIGPVTDALMDALETDFTVICPALPVNGRTIYNGYLFVEGVPLNESGMANHPITPMTDASLKRLMESQSQGKVGVVHLKTVKEGVQAVREELTRLRDEGYRYAVLDAVSDEHVVTLGQAVNDMVLITGGSGLGGAVAKANSDPQAATEASFELKTGPAVILSGSASVRTNEQVAAYREHAPSFPIDVDNLMTDAQWYEDVVYDWYWANNTQAAPLIYSTANPDQVKALQEKFTGEAVSAQIEEFFGNLAKRLANAGVERIIVAGGETSGAVTTALEISGFQVGPSIAPGVPWVRSLDDKIDIALKSGNFGAVDFFAAAQDKA